MKLLKIVLSSIFLVIPFLDFAQSEEIISIESLLNDMIDREAVASFPKTNF